MADNKVVVERQIPHKVVTCPTDDGKEMDAIGMVRTITVHIDEPYGDRQVEEARQRAMREYERQECKPS
jgi:hypothetical protein